jgi:hypothetical protein
MTTRFVPDDLSTKHENEWQALRQLAENNETPHGGETRSTQAFTMRHRSGPDAGNVALAG